MDDHESHEQGTAESNGVAQRQAALRALAQSQIQRQTPDEGATPSQRLSAPASERTAPAPHARSGFAALISGRRPAHGGGRRALIASVVVALVLVVIAAGVGARVLLARRTPPPPTVVRIDSATGGLTCGAQSAAWSPDSTLLAVRGGTGCGASDGVSTNAIIVYDTRTGKVAQTLRPDPIVLGDEAVSSAATIARKKLGDTDSNSTPNELFYGQVAWAPDERSLLEPFNISVSPPDSGQGITVSGLLRLSLATGSQSRVWLDKIQYQQNGFAERWDLTTGTSTLVPLPKSTTTYSWNSDGSLAEVDQTADPSIGNPDGGQRFSIWQPGMMGYDLLQTNPTQPVTPDAWRVVWGAQVTPISPDGRYLYSYFPTFGVLVPPSTGAPISDVPSIKPHDRALLAQAERMTQAGPSENALGYDIAWRPDGRQMAVMTHNNSAGKVANPAAYVISLYDTATGKLIGHISPKIKVSDQPVYNTLLILQWSPDGKRLMLSESGDNAITIWEPGALPA